MPSIEARRNASGKITSYRITVSDGTDYKGNPIRHRILWTPPKKGMTERQMEKEAYAAAAKYEEQIKVGYYIDNNQTFCEYAQYVMELKERTGIKTSTLDRYLEMLPRIYEAIGHMKLSQIRPQHLNEFYRHLGQMGMRADSQRAIPKRIFPKRFHALQVSQAELARVAGVGYQTINTALKGNAIKMDKANAIAEAMGMTFSTLFDVKENLKPLSAKTVREHHRLISTILAQAEKEMLIPYNPAQKATPPKVERTVPEYYQQEEMDEILEALEKAPVRWKAISYVLIDTGCRRGEALGLKWDKIDLETGLIVIDRSLLYSPSKGIYESTTKTNDVRAMILAPQTIDALKAWKEEYEQWKEINGDRWKNSPYVFVREDGGPMHPDSVTDWLARFSKENVLPHIHPHAFRHTAASTMIMNGVDVVTAAAEMGHASPSTTANIYAHQFAIARAKAANVRGGVFAKRK